MIISSIFLGRWWREKIAAKTAVDVADVAGVQFRRWRQKRVRTVSSGACWGRSAGRGSSVECGWWWWRRLPWVAVELLIGGDGGGGGGGGRAGYDVGEGGDHDGEFIVVRKTVLLKRRHRWRCEGVLSHGSLSDLSSLERVVHVSVSSSELLLLLCCSSCSCQKNVFVGQIDFLVLGV